MAVDFDNFPFYDGLVKGKPDRMSDVWRDSLATHIQSLVGYLTQFGILMPQLTTSQRDSIQSPANGQMIYNTDLGTAQYFKAGAWTSF